MDNMSDLDFLEKMGFKPEFLAGLYRDKPIFSVAIDHTLVCRGGFAHVFTHDPRESIKDDWECLEATIRTDLKERLDYANSQISQARSGKKMLFSYSEEEYAEEIAQINESIKTIESIPKWWDMIKFDDVGYFDFEYGSKYNSLNVSKIRVEDVKKMYLLVQDFAQNNKDHKMDISARSDFYKSFIMQGVEFILDNMHSPYVELNVPSVKEVELRKDIVEKLFDDYSSIPTGSLIQVNHPYIPYVFARKTSPIIAPSYSDYSLFWDNSFAIQTDTVMLGYDRRVKDNTVMQIELRDVLPLNPSVKLIPYELETKTIDDAIRSLNTKHIYVKKDDLVASSGSTKSWDDGVKRIYDGLKIKND